MDATLRNFIIGLVLTAGLVFGLEVNRGFRSAGSLETKLRERYCQIATERLKAGRAISDAEKYKNECVEVLNAR